MEKEAILQMSREENEGKRDEREMAAVSAASAMGMLAGGLVCILLVFVGRYVVNIPEISFAGWMVYFAMYGGNNLALYKSLGNRRNLVWGIVSIVLSVAFGAAIVLKNVL